MIMTRYILDKHKFPVYEGCLYFHPTASGGVVLSC